MGRSLGDATHDGVPRGQIHGGKGMHMKSRGGSSVPVLVPVYGAFFNYSFEVCMRREEYRQPWCWNDLFVARGANALLKAALTPFVAPFTLVCGHL